MQNAARICCKWTLGWLSGAGCALWERKDAVWCSAVWKKWGKFNSIHPTGRFCDHPKWLTAKLLWKLLEFSVSLVPNNVFDSLNNTREELFNSESIRNGCGGFETNKRKPDTTWKKSERPVESVGAQSSPRCPVQARSTPWWNWRPLHIGKLTWQSSDPADMAW